MQTKKSKIYAERLGRFSETVAVIFLRLKGYRILKRRYKTHVGEIDIIAARWKTLVILEIKYRKTRVMQRNPLPLNKDKESRGRPLSFSKKVTAIHKFGLMLF